MAINNPSLGFGTAGLGDIGYQSVTHALQAGFRTFDTAEENDYWYDQQQVGEALESFFAPWDEKDEDNHNNVDDDNDNEDTNYLTTTSTSRYLEQDSICQRENLKISTKIPPWELTSFSHIRQRAHESRETLLGFCNALGGDEAPYPLDVYYIHAPKCWDGWHERCNENTPPLLELRQAWQAMEAVVGVDGNAQRIGLSNISPAELLDIIQFVMERKEMGKDDVVYPPPRIPDVVQAYADPLHPAVELRELCHEYGIEFVSYSTLGTQHRMGRNNPVLGNGEIQGIAHRFGRSAAEVVLSWALQRG